VTVQNSQNATRVFTSNKFGVPSIVKNGCKEGMAMARRRFCCADFYRCGLMSGVCSWAARLRGHR